MEIVILDLKNYLKRNIFPSKTVLVFPPFNGFRRFLIHKLIEDNFASADVTAFSIGQDINRRIVVCYKGLVRSDQNKGIPVSTQTSTRHNMIESEGQIRQKNSPSAAVYRPPAARIAETRQRGAETKSDLSKRSRVRRPDQQMYVPRPKRASFGEEQPRSRSSSSSRTSLENESCDKRKLSSKHSFGETVPPDDNEAVNKPLNDKSIEKSVTKTPSHSPDKKDIKSSPSTKNHNNLEGDTITGITTNISHICPDSTLNTNMEDSYKSIQTSVESDQEDSLKNETDKEELKNKLASVTDCIISTKTTTAIKTVVDIPHENKISELKMSIKEDTKQKRIKDSIMETSYNTDSCESSENDRISQVKEVNTSDIEVMETISLSSDSRDSISTSVSDAKDTSSTDSSKEKEKGSAKMEIGSNTGSKKVHRKTKSKSQERTYKNKIKNDLPVTNDILIISDSSSSNDDLKCKKEQESSIKVNIEGPKKPVKEKIDKPPKRNKIVNPEECDWESLYDDSGECLVPDLMEELTNSVGKVHIATADSDYRPYQSIEERSNDGECVIEIYDFPAEFKTSDLINIFAAYRNKNFQIKWVDDTHALGIFPSPLIADEVLACTLPFVKTRPLRLGIAESRLKARNLILPPLPSMERPKTCTALARRLVSGALGLRLPTSSQDREKEKQVLKEAREKRRLEAKQKEAAWDGTLTNSSCI